MIAGPSWTSAIPIADADDRPAWLEARRPILTSTEIAKAATDSGRQQVIAEKLYGISLADNRQFAHGRERESEIARQAALKHGVLPNRFLFVRDGIGATPDGIHPELKKLGEYKTSVKALPKTFPRVYRDQVLIALHVFEAEETIIGWEHHINGVPADLEPTWLRFVRDQERIDYLLGIQRELADFLAKERLTLAY